MRHEPKTIAAILLFATTVAWSREPAKAEAPKPVNPIVAAWVKRAEKAHDNMEELALQEKRLKPEDAKARRRLKHQSMIEASYMLVLVKQAAREPVVVTQGEFEVVPLLVPLSEATPDPAQTPTVELTFVYSKGKFVMVQLNELPKGFYVKYQPDKPGELVISNRTSHAALKMDTPFEITAL